MIIFFFSASATSGEPGTELEMGRMTSACTLVSAMFELEQETDSDDEPY